MTVFFKPLVGFCVCLLLCTLSFFTGMSVQAHRPVLYRASEPVGHDILKFVRQQPVRRFPAWQFDSNYLYPWSNDVMGGSSAVLPNRPLTNSLQPTSALHTTTATYEAFVQSLKEQIAINEGHIINGELYDKNGKETGVDAPEIRRVFAREDPRYMLAHAAHVWNNFVLRARCRTGERLFHLLGDTSGNLLPAGSPLQKERFLQRYLNSVWQWEIYGEQGTSLP